MLDLIVPLTGESPTTWANSAACKGNSQLFFPKPAERPQARERREAKAMALCSSCIVQAQCRTFARDNHEYGVWGAESELDRHLAGYSLMAPIGLRAQRPA
jgi:WhiB family transcriptional regulator, redox-sensing transcriptional regulator